MCTNNPKGTPYGCKKQYIGITSNRMKHIIGVAEECYDLAKNTYNLSEKECKRAYVIGYLHDIGYAFSEQPENHSIVGYELLKLIGLDCTEVLKHGNPDSKQEIYLKILNTADLTVNSVGKKVSMEERLEDIKKRHGVDAEYYKNPEKLTKILKKIK